MRDEVKDAKILAERARRDAYKAIAAIFGYRGMIWQAAEAVRDAAHRIAPERADHGAEPGGER